MKKKTNAAKARNEKKRQARRRRKSFGRSLITILIIGVVAVALLYFGRKGIRALMMLEEHQFNVTKILVPKKGMEDQGTARLCWAYTGLSMLEAEMMRIGKEPINLSEAYIAYYNSLDRCQYAINNEDARWNFGGCLADVWETIKRHGVVPEEYMAYSSDQRHHQMNIELMGDDGLIARTRWAIAKGDERDEKMCRKNIVVAHERCFDEPPAAVALNEDSVSPQDFWAQIGLDVNDYVQVTSVTSVGYGKWVTMDYPDHWRKVKCLNVDLDKMMELIGKSIDMGYTVAWDGDISNWNFSYHFQNGFAKLAGKKERWVSPEVRQRALDNAKTWDDHTLLVVGTAKDENDNDYYLMKNSWGKQLPNGGMLFVSPAYVRYRTVMLTFHKDVLKDVLK